MGRHREFDIDQALEAAMGVFWGQGYEGTSYDDLTRATGVKRPGLYAAFGNKEELFRRVLARYAERHMGYMCAALREPTSRQMVEGVLRGAAEITTRYPDHRGCLVLNGALACSAETRPIRELLVDFRSQTERALRERLEHFKQDHDLPPSANCAGLAAYLTAVAHGMAVLAKAGVSNDVLDSVIEQTLAGWPPPPKPG